MVKLIRYLPRLKAKKPVYYDGRLNEMLEGFRNAVENHNTSIVLVVDGRSGLGKTTISNQIGIHLDPEFSLNKIHYVPKTFLEGDEKKIGLANCKAGDFILFDEAMLISNRSALTQINKMIIQAMSMIRSKRIYVCFCVNSIFDLDRNLAISRADILVHVYGQSLIDRGRFCTFFKGRDGTDRLKKLYLYGKKFYDYNRPKSNFIGKFTKEFIVNERLYEKQKQKGVNEFLKGESGQLGSLQRRALVSRNKIVNYLYNEEGWKASRLSEISGLGKDAIYAILRKKD